MIFIIPTSIFANSGKLSLEFKYGSAFAYPGFEPSDISSDLFPNRPDFGNTIDNIGLLTIFSGSDSEKLRNYVLAQNAPDARLKNKEYEILFNYAVSEKSSFGISVNKNGLDAENIGYSTWFFFLGYSYYYNLNNPLNLTTFEILGLEGLFPYYRERVRNFRDFRTINLNYTYSFASSASKFVPYVRLEMGGGREQKFHNKVYRVGAGIGARVYVHGQNYVSMEAVGVNYDVYEKSDFLWSILEYSVKIGLGRRF